MGRVWVSSYNIALLGVKMLLLMYLIKNERKLSHFEILIKNFKGQI
jgi:hypothetical protein